jgi:hypothetical protein
MEPDVVQKIDNMLLRLDEHVGEVISIHAMF